MNICKYLYIDTCPTMWLHNPILKNMAHIYKIEIPYIHGLFMFMMSTLVYMFSWIFRWKEGHLPVAFMSSKSLPACEMTWTRLGWLGRLGEELVCGMDQVEHGKITTRCPMISKLKPPVWCCLFVFKRVFGWSYKHLGFTLPQCRRASSNTDFGHWPTRLG